MDRDTKEQPEGLALRQRVESLLRDTLQLAEGLISPEARQLLYDLRVRQLELELQVDSLQAREMELRLVTDNVGGHVSRLNRDLRYLFVNSECEKLFGKTREVLLRSTMREALDPKTFAYVEPYTRRALAGERVSFEVQFKTLQQKTVYWMVNFVPDINKAGEVIGFFNITYDITDRKLAELKLQESEARTSLLLKSSNVGLWDWNLSADEVYFSPEWKQQLGYEDHELTNRFAEWDSRLHPADRESALSLAQDFIAGRVSKYINEFRLRHKDGSYRWILAQANLVRSSSGRPTRMIGSHIDITERKVVEARLRVSDLALRDISQGVIITNTERRILWVNDAFTTITGYSLEEALGRTCRFLQGPLTDQSLVTTINETLSRSEAFSGEILNYRKDGTTHWNDLSISPVFDEQNQLINFIGITRDITKQKTAQLEREQLERKMQDAQRLESLGVLAGGIAHDFNNLLTGISGNASLLALDLPEDSPLQEYTAQINQIVERAAELCRQMLAYSGRGRFVIQPIELGRFVEETAQLLQISLSKKTELRFQLAPKLPMIAADVAQLRQVIMNLVINAAEAIGEEGGLIKISSGAVIVDSTYLKSLHNSSGMVEGEYVLLEVSDNGCGMSPETKSRIFDPFFTTKFTGRGLGLAAVLGIMRGHHGGLEVHSVLGQGTTFRLLFPVTESVRAQETAVSTSTRGINGTFLVVDDEEFVRSSVRRILQRLGFEVVLASNGQEAIEIYSKEPSRFRLVLLDLMMPVLDGMGAFSQLRAISPALPVVLMSGYNQQEVLARFPGEGPSGFLTKPFTLDSLQTAIQRALIPAL